MIIIVSVTQPACFLAKNRKLCGRNFKDEYFFHRSFQFHRASLRCTKTQKSDLRGAEKRWRGNCVKIWRKVKLFIDFFEGHATTGDMYVSCCTTCHPIGWEKGCPVLLRGTFWVVSRLFQHVNSCNLWYIVSLCMPINIWYFIRENAQRKFYFVRESISILINRHVSLLQR